MGELIIALGVIGILAMILFPILTKAKPDENELLHKKATFILERVVNELSTDEFLYPKSGDYSGLSNTAPVIVNGETHEGNTKFCTLFASRLNKAAGTAVDCRFGRASVKSAEGIDWYLPITDFKNGEFETIKVDVNGSKGPNCMKKSAKCYHPDQFEYQVRKGIKLAVKTANNMNPTTPPPARPNMGDEPGGDTTDPRTGQNWYCIRCNPATNGTIYGFGCNKPNGHYQLVAIPNIGYKGSWFTKSVTINNADVPASECAVTFSPIVDIPKADGGTVTPPPVTPDPTPDKTYCINVTKTGGDTTQCTVAGDGCGKKRGTYTVSASGKTPYKTSWATKDVTIEDKDVNLTVVCDKDPEPDPCYSISFTGDTTNCPVTPPTGTCTTDKTKFTPNTYSYTVTPKAGYSYSGTASASTKQVIVNNTNVTVPIECAAAVEEPTKLKVNWSGHGLSDVTISLRAIAKGGSAKGESFTIKGDNSGTALYDVSAGSYTFMANAGGRVSGGTAIGAIKVLGVTLSPTSMEIPKGTTGELNISLSDYPEEPEVPKYGSLNILLVTNGMATTFFALDIGNYRISKSGRWGDSRIVTESGIPVGTYTLSPGRCQGDFGGPVYTAGYARVSTSSVTIQEGKAAEVEYSCIQDKTGIDKPKYQIITNTDGNGTWISGGGTYEQGDICILSATNGDFDGWYDRTDGGNVLASKSRNYRFVVTKMRMMFAKYNP